jgi:hypothetical protein
MDDSTALRIKKRMTSPNERTLQEQITLNIGLESRLADIYNNSKAKRQTILGVFCCN